MTLDRQWWRTAVIYQIYVKSFADSDGDGVGDLDGITAHLDHLADLGVDGLWLNPVYPSPGHDGGYDVADYLSVDARYGGIAALDRLIAAAHDRNLKVLLDIVPNHCSVEHPWFQAALAEPPDGPHRKRFIFRDGRGPGGAAPPNNWRSVFGGPAWTRVTDPDGRPGQWYLHSFDASQPDFDWRNLIVAEHFEQVLRAWFDRGVDGFRVDVAARLIKHRDLTDYDPQLHVVAPNGNQPEVHDIYRTWRRIVEQYRPEADLMLIGEVWAPTTDHLAEFVRPDELHQAFYFDLMQQPWDAQAFRASTQRALDAAGDGFAWVLNSHDAHRSVSRYGLLRPSGNGSADVMGRVLRPRGEVDIQLGTARARAVLVYQLALPGAAYLYQGEELGLPEVMDIADDARQDPIWFRSGGTEHGRDGCRVPLPWTRDRPTFGFGGAPAWLPQPDWFADYNVQDQEADPDSTLSLCRSALALRRKLIVDSEPALHWLPTPGRDDVLAFRRSALTVVVVFGDTPWEVPADWGTEVLCSTAATDRLLPPSSAAWLLDG